MLGLLFEHDVVFRIEFCFRPVSATTSHMAIALHISLLCDRQVAHRQWHDPLKSLSPLIEEHPELLVGRVSNQLQCWLMPALKYRVSSKH